MALTTDRQIVAGKRNTRAAIVSVDLTNPTSIDGEAIRNGITRKVRRVTFHNMDNNVVRCTLAQWTTAVGSGVTLNKSVILANFGNGVLEPPETEEWVVQLRGPAAGTTRLAAATALIDGAASVNGVELNLEYYDDLD